VPARAGRANRDAPGVDEAGFQKPGVVASLVGDQMPVLATGQLTTMAWLASEKVLQDRHWRAECGALNVLQLRIIRNWILVATGCVARARGRFIRKKTNL
jgi:hypothetical protein